MSCSLGCLALRQRFRLHEETASLEGGDASVTCEHSGGAQPRAAVSETTVGNAWERTNSRASPTLLVRLSPRVWDLDLDFMCRCTLTGHKDDVTNLSAVTLRTSMPTAAAAALNGGPAPHAGAPQQHSGNGNGAAAGQGVNGGGGGGNNVVLPSTVVASASADGTVRLWCVRAALLPHSRAPLAPWAAPAVPTVCSPPKRRTRDALRPDARSVTHRRSLTWTCLAVLALPHSHAEDGHDTAAAPTASAAARAVPDAAHAPADARAKAAHATAAGKTSGGAANGHAAGAGDATSALASAAARAVPAALCAVMTGSLVCTGYSDGEVRVWPCAGVHVLALQLVAADLGMFLPWTSSEVRRSTFSREITSPATFVLRSFPAHGVAASPQGAQLL